MGVLHIVVLSALCLLSARARNEDGSCFINGKTFQNGDTVSEDCVVCECVNGQLIDCQFVSGCTYAQNKEQPADGLDEINYSDEPDVFESSDSTGHSLKKRSLNMLGMQSSSEAKVNAGLQLGGISGFGTQGGVGLSGGEDKRVQDELRKISELKQQSSAGFKFGGKFGYGHGSIEEHGKIDVNIKGRNKGSSEEKSSEEQKGNFKFGGKFSHERGGHGKGRSSESSEEDNSEEHEGENPEPEVPINPAPEGSVAPNLPVEPEEPVQPEVPVNTPEPEAPVQPEIPVNTPEPEAPDQPEIPVNTPEPEAPVQPEIPVNTPEPEAPVQPEIPVNTPEPEAPVQPEIPVNTPEPEAPIQPEISVPESSPSNGKSCTFNAQFVLHGQTVELACSTCTCNDGSLTCVKNLNCPGICSVIGLQMIRTFDGTLYNSPGNCDYVLAKTSDFTISLENELCSDLGYNNYNPDAICIKSVEIYIPQKASLKLLHDGTIQSTGEAADLPYSILDTITVLKSSSVFLDVASPLFNIQYDWVGNRLYVILDPSYKGQTAGLCGTYNDNRNDDYRSANDMTETVSSFFSKSWKTQYQCSEDTKDPEDIGQKADADWVCSDALDNSLFEDCALLIDTHSYKISCSSNVYYLNENEGLCAALADYAYRCARAGIFAPVSSSFPDCIPACRESMVAITEDSLAQHDCAEYTSTLLKITSSIPLNEVCICPSNLYYDSSLNECVKGDYCPCYSNNHLYKLGDTITQANGQTCPCERITQCGDREETPPEPEPCPDNEKYADCQFSSGTLCEPSCMNLAIIDQGCTLECTPGCVCKPGLMRSSEGNCVPLNECTCTHGDDIYVPGATLAKDCNTCTCENGKFSCTHNPCNKVCNAYGGSQFFLFDNVWKSFDTKHCGIVLVESRENETPFFRVVMQNTPNEAMGGALLKKTIYIAFGGASVVLSEFDTTVAQELGSNTQVKIYRSGFYQVAQFLGLTVYYDQHLDVIIQLAPQLQGKVQGMCGDADGTTTTELAISNMAQYASQFLTEECPDQQSTLPPPSDNHKKFVETRCSLLKGDDFSECHTVVNVDPYYVACVEETEACREGESCLCYCTALAAYARACCRKGITIDWRSPDTCPSPCEYYNRDGGEGPYRIVMMNGKTLVIDYENNAVSLENVDVPGDLKASFMVTSSLYVDQQNGRKLISLESAQHHNYFIVQNDDQTLSLRKWQPSVEFRKRATFILRSDRWVTGYDALESYSLRGLYLSIYGEALVMSKVKSVNMLQMNFKLIEESFGLPSFSICTWKYRSCGSPCIPTCQDPLGTKCTLTLKVEGCYPICAPEMVFDEVTHRCVQFADCVTPPVGPYTTPIPTSPVSTTIEPCRNVICKTYSCADGEYPQEVPSSDPCCPKYVCTPILPPVTTQPPTKSCSDVECKIEPCADGEYLQEVPSTDPCCQKYVCVPISSPATTGPPTVEPCRNVVCEPPVKCTKNGADLAEIPWDNICCPRYECQCQVICDPLPICRDSSPPLRIGDPNVDCCPAYECIETRPTTPPIKCAGVDCPTTVCTGDGNLVEVPSEDPCCQAYECIYPEPTPTPNVCDGVTCAEYQCPAGQKLLVKQSSDDPCCASFDCVPTETTPPPVWTPTPGKCDNVVCQTANCFMTGSKPVQVFSDGCCPEFECECEPCSPVPSCNGNKPIMTIDPEMDCCPSYRCPDEATPPPRPVPTTPEPCRNVVCEPPVKCTKNGADLAEIPWDNICCPRYECQCQVICDPLPICRDSSPPFRIGDPDVDCCPAYECIETPPTTPPIKCAGVDCPTTVCTGDGNLVEVPSEDPCCQAYECIYPEPTPTPNVCDGVTCAEYQCPAGQKLLVKQSSDDPCCASFDCVPTETTPPPVWTPTPGKCDNVVCQTANCFMTGSKPVQVFSDGCCPEFECECEPCSPVPSCNGNKPIMTIDPEMDCCPSYRCPDEATPPPRPVPTTPAPTTPEPCKDVLCEAVTCEKKGSSLDIIPWAESCCTHFVCTCKEECDPIPICFDGRPAVRVGDPDTECCPSYNCEPPLPPCANVICPDIQCPAGLIPIEYAGDDPCCRQRDCVPVTPVPVTSPTTPGQCFGVTCIKPECGENEKQIVKVNSNDPCCPSYDCIPPPTPPSSTPEIPNNCDHECPVIDCFKVGASEEYVGGDDPCCPDFKCVCQPCNPAPTCGDNSQAVVTEFDPNSECCPTYDCQFKPETTTPIFITTPIPTPDHCSNILCEPVVCTKKGATVLEYPWANDCCPHYVCECTQACSPIPQCQDGTPPIRTQDPKSYCCPDYICQQPTPEPTTPEPCADIPCFVPPCDSPAVLVEVPGDDHCCKNYECIPPMTPPPTTTPEICDESLCEPSNCDEGDRVFVKAHPEGGCCPVYQCIPPSTLPPETTPTPDECENVVCRVEECTKQGSYAVSTGRDECCETYSCVCQPCSPAPICENLSVTVNADTQCCPIYACPPPPPTPTIPITTPPNPCENSVCEAVTCTKQGATAERREWADPCCQLFVCECTEECSPPPVCQDGRPPFRTQDPEHYCCPEFACLPPTTEPIVTRIECEGVTCTIPPCYGDYFLSEVASNDPCCRSYECNPLATTPPPTPPVPPCDGSGCSNIDCEDGYTKLTKHDPDDDCCPIYECIPPPTLPPTPPTPHGCERVECNNVEECTREGAVPVLVDWENECCPIYECECQPCSPAPVCENPFVDFDSNTQCCPSYACPPPTPSPTPEEPCSNRVCESITCTKHGATAKRIEWADPCCPLFVCECTEECSPVPECPDGTPPLRTQDSELYCCPEYECVPPTPVSATPGNCEGVTCTTPSCFGGSTMIRVPSKDPCCDGYECIPPPEPPTPTPPVPPCDGSGCSNIDCEDGYTKLTKRDPDDDCCPIYECIPPPTSPPTPPTPHGCEGIICNREECPREGAVSVAVDWEDKCCPIYECQCQLCIPPLSCNDENLVVHFDPNIQCCPVYECAPPTPSPPSPTPKPNPCENRVCEPLTCTKQGASLEMKEWADPCCPLFVCECTEECSPVPECSDGTPPLRTQDPESYCCPEYECVPPTPVPVTPGQCDGVTCTTPSCFGGYTLIRVPPKDPCCEGYECIPPTTSVPPTPKPPCDASGCEDIDCGPGYTKLTKHDPDDDCCPIYECIPPPTSPPEPTPDECRGVVCNVKECTKDGAKAVVVDRDNCCDVYECECQPCNAVPYCDGQIPYAAMNPDTECCPTYECPPPLPPTPTIPITTTPNPCENRVCEPVTCTKQGATLERREWADPCCPLYVCECTEECSPLPVCQDGRPPFRTQDTESYCCPEYACLPPTSEPLVTPRQCEGVTCAIEPCYGDYSLIEVSSNDPCCRSYECIPPPTTLPPITSFCDGSGCAPSNCDDGDRVMSRHNPDDDCCPIFECIPPSTTPIPRTTPPPENCKDTVCEVTVCSREGEIAEFISQDECCEVHECRCQPCSPTPICDGGQAPYQYIDINTQCCPSYECPLPTPPPETPPPIIPTSPENPCSNRLCEPVLCTKVGATVSFSGWIDECCPQIICECKQLCDPPPTCENGLPPFRTQDPEEYCCPEYVCITEISTPQPTTTLEPPCEGVTCFSPTCESSDILVEIAGNDPCCKNYVCVPPITNPPPLTPPICDVSQCPPTPECSKSIIVKPNPDYACCPIYECRDEPTPNPIISTPSDCVDISCDIKQCTKEGETPTFVGWLNACCRDYECQCQPCHPTPTCDGRDPIASINPDTQCCPTYECRPPPTTEEPPTTIIRSTAPGVKCEDRECPVKVCGEQERLVSQINPADPCCPLQTCECSCKTIPSCESDERLVAVQQSNQCCPKLRCEKKRDECYAVPTHVTLSAGHCSAEVILSSCSGYCHSYTEYSDTLTAVSQCRCCSVTRTQAKTFELPCQDGSKINWTVQEASECGCNKCSEEDGSESGSGSGSGGNSGSGEEEGSGFSLWSSLGIAN